MSDKGKEFRESIKFDVDYSKIDVEKYLHPKPDDDSSEDPSRGDRVRTKEEEKARDKKAISNSEQGFNEFVEHLNGGFSPEMIKGEKKELFIKKVISLECELLGISPPSYSMFSYVGPEPSFGMYISSAGMVSFKDGSFMEAEADTMYINSAMPIDTEDDYREFLDTIIHEVRHKYQDEARENPISHPEISSIGQDYLEFSEQQYAEDAKKFEDYWKNGLEQDARAFARARTNQYMAYTIDQILELDTPPRRAAKSQILMEPGDSYANGKNAPITSSSTISEDKFGNFREQKNISDNQDGDNIRTGGNSSMAQMTAGTDFSEQAQAAAAKVYGNCIESIQNFSEKVIEHFTERIKTHPYKQLENVGNVFIKYYNEELPREIKSAISDWISSDNSFSASLKEQYEGDESASVSAAQKTENKLTDQVDASFKTIQPIKINKPITIDKEMIISDAEYVEGLSKQLANLKDQWLERFSKLGEQNSLYATMSPMVATTFTNVEAGYQATYKDIMNVSEEFRDARNTVFSRDTERGKELKGNIKNLLDKFHGTRKNKH